MLDPSERRALLRLAREAIAAHLTGGVPPGPVPLSAPFDHAGAFVTLRADGRLRGCIGYPGATGPLDRVVARAAIAAATADPRFPAVTVSELPGLEVEISVLTPIVPVADLGEIEVGRDGLVAEEGFRKGLLLPQVATEQHWDRETFLTHACLKAGLRPDAWRRGARISRFQAEVIQEESGASQRNRN